MNHEERSYHRGDIFLANLNPYVGSEQGGTRPVLILQNDAGNLFSPTLIVAPITSRMRKKPALPTHYILDGIDNLLCPCIVLCEQIRTIDKRRVREYISRVPREKMDEISENIRASLGLPEPIPETMEAP